MQLNFISKTKMSPIDEITKGILSSPQAKIVIRVVENNLRTCAAIYAVQYGYYYYNLYNIDGTFYSTWAIRPLYTTEAIKSLI